MSLQSASAEADAASTAPIDAAVVPCPLMTAYLELSTTTEAGAPVPGVAYRVVDAHDNEHTGVTDASGKARIEQLFTGQCRVSFPEVEEVDGAESTPAAGAAGTLYTPGKVVNCPCNAAYVFYMPEGDLTEPPAEAPAANPTGAQPQSEDEESEASDDEAIDWQ